MRARRCVLEQTLAINLEEHRQQLEPAAIGEHGQELGDRRYGAGLLRHRRTTSDTRALRGTAGLVSARRSSAFSDIA